jgi:TIR domain
MASKVFLSYRRNDSPHASGRLRDRLAEAFGEENVFYDVDSIPAGRDFREVIRTAIQAADAVVVMIGPGFDVDRLNDQRDYVRTELLEAFRQKKVIVPVLIDTTSMPTAAALPTSLRELAYINASLIRRDPDFRRDCERVIAVLRRTGNTGGSAFYGAGPAGSALGKAAPAGSESATLDLLTDTPSAQPDAIIRVPRTESRREQASEITNEAYEQVEREKAEEQARLRREMQLRRNASRVARALQDHGVTPTELWPGTSRGSDLWGYREPDDGGDGIRVGHNIEKRSYGPVRGWLIHQQMLAPPSTYGEGSTIRYQLGDDGKIYENATPIEHPSNAEMDKIKRYLAYYGAQKGLDRELFRNDDA